MALLTLISFRGISQNCNSESTTTTLKFKLQTIGIVISSNDPETVWNAFRLANYSIEQGDTVSVFLLGKGVESPNISTTEFNVKEMMQTFSDKSGKLSACGTCLALRKTEGTELCPVLTLSDSYAIIKTNEKILTF